MTAQVHHEKDLHPGKPGGFTYHIRGSKLHSLPFVTAPVQGPLKKFYAPVCGVKKSSNFTQRCEFIPHLFITFALKTPRKRTHTNLEHTTKESV